MAKYTSIRVFLDAKTGKHAGAIFTTFPHDASHGGDLHEKENCIGVPSGQACTVDVDPDYYDANLQDPKDFHAHVQTQYTMGNIKVLPRLKR